MDNEIYVWIMVFAGFMIGVIWGIAAAYYFNKRVKPKIFKMLDKELPNHKDYY